MSVLLLFFMGTGCMGQHWCESLASDWISWTVINLPLFYWYTRNCIPLLSYEWRPIFKLQVWTGSLFVQCVMHKHEIYFNSLELKSLNPPMYSLSSLANLHFNWGICNNSAWSRSSGIKRCFADCKFRALQLHLILSWITSSLEKVRVSSLV